MKLRELYTVLKDVLKEASESPGSEALSILSKVTSQTRERLLMNFEEEIDENVCQMAISLSKKRANGYPLQYITERCYFHGLEVYVCEGVFVPRIETELLVDLALELIEERSFKVVADIGTGTGCIAIAIALESQCEVFATDVSERALETARRNIERYKVHVQLLKGAYLAPLRSVLNDVQLIVSNPPYVSTRAELPADVKKEPHEALFAGEDGLEFYRNFFSDPCLLARKTIIMEMSPEQEGPLRDLLKGLGTLTFLKDQFSRTRFFRLDVA